MKSGKLFLRGIKDGMPICIGYLSVAFAFGIFAVGSGLSAFEALLMSMTNVTSAGQLSAVPIIAGSGTLIELAFTQFVINLRYSLMSVSLSQKFDDKVTLFDKLIIAFVNTDEVFAVASSKVGKLSKSYMFGLILTPFVGWSGGTVVGALAGNIFPDIVVSSLGIAIYGMFIAIVFPIAKKEKKTFLCVMCALLLSFAFWYIPYLNKVPEGFSIIICALLSSAVFAVIDCSKKEKEAE